LLFCLIGSYTVNDRIVDVFTMILFGLVGYLMKKMNFAGAPLILALVLGPMLEDNLRRSLMISYGSFSIFFTSPIAAAFIGFALLLLVAPLLKLKGKRVIPPAPPSEE
jgi:putative tricarboxylic transport membrane protein